jgi:hypothetical protein
LLGIWFGFITCFQRCWNTVSRLLGPSSVAYAQRRLAAELAGVLSKALRTGDLVGGGDRKLRPVTIGAVLCYGLAAFWRPVSAAFDCPWISLLTLAPLPHPLLR